MSSVSITYGASTNIGRRPSQQDEYLVVENILSDLLSPSYLFAVFDGHGSDGGKASHFAKTEFPKLLQSSQQSFLTNPKGTIESIFKTLHNNMIETDASQVDTYLSGTTASVYIIWEKKVLFAHAGDSHALLGVNVSEKGVYSDKELGVKDGDEWLPWVGEGITNDKGNRIKGVRLTREHTCQNQVEMDRVVSHGGRIERLQLEDNHYGPQRIFKGTLPYPGLVVTRSLGDSVAQKLGVLADPEIRIFDLTPEMAYLVVASDGVWDGLSNEDVNGIIGEYYFRGVNSEDYALSPMSPPPSQPLENGDKEGEVREENKGNAEPTSPRTTLRDTVTKKASRSLTKKSLAGLDKTGVDDNTTNVVVCLWWE